MNTLQRTDAWFAEREGKLTASAFGQAAGIAPGSRQQLWRRLKGIDEFEGNAATEWGVDHEDTALSAYVSTRKVSTKVAQVGFIVHPTYEWLGASPDCLIDDNGLGEIKCPFTQQIYPEIPVYYMAQMQGQMEVTDRSFCDFIVWTPERMKVWRVARSRSYWNWLHVRLADFWSYVEANIEPPRSKRPKPPDTDDLILFEEEFELTATAD